MNRELKAGGLYTNGAIIFVLVQVPDFIDAGGMYGLPLVEVKVEPCIGAPICEMFQRDKQYSLSKWMQQYNAKYLGNINDIAQTTGLAEKVRQMYEKS